MFSVTSSSLGSSKLIVTAARRKSLAARQAVASNNNNNTVSKRAQEPAEQKEQRTSPSSSSSGVAPSLSSPSSIAHSGPPWHRALHAFSQQLFAGQDLSTEVATRIAAVFEQGGSAADFLRWWIVFRCEDAPATTEEARALLRHNMWKQALYTASISPSAFSPAETASSDFLPTTRGYTEFGHYAVVAACRSGNWQLALSLCSTWKEANDEKVASSLGITPSPLPKPVSLSNNTVSAAAAASSTAKSKTMRSLLKKRMMMRKQQQHLQKEQSEDEAAAEPKTGVMLVDGKQQQHHLLVEQMAGSAQSSGNELINSATWRAALEILFCSTTTRRDSTSQTNN